MTQSAPLLPDWLTHDVRNFPQRLALQAGQTYWTFRELDQRVMRLAGQFAACDVLEGTRVAVLAKNSLAYVVCVHALMRLGAILVPLNTRLTLDELRWQVSDVKASLLVSDSAFTDSAVRVAENLPALRVVHLVTEANAAAVTLQDVPEREVPLRPLIDLQATQAILYTSGTTGQPKGVSITYGMHWWNAIGSVLNLGLQADDCWLACLPFFHIGGLSILMRSVIYGSSVVVLEKFDAQEVNRCIREDNVTLISVVAVMLQRMLSALNADSERARYPSTLRCILLGGGPAPYSLLEACAQRSIPVVQTYGLTEACSQAATLAPADALRKLGSAGRPLLPVQLRIMIDGHVAPVGEPGVICLKGPTITPGYVDRPAATAQVLQDGWFTTGDIGYLDEEGYLYVLDRRSDLIVSGGENVYPAEIEAVLQAHPDVEEAGVCGQADAQWGQVPVAFVRLRAGRQTNQEALLLYAKEHLARFKLPKALYFVNELPRNSSGKLLRRELPRFLP